jgi:hypothetical protein
MAKVEKFGAVERDLTKAQAALVSLQKKILLAADDGDALRLAKINEVFPDLRPLHGVLKAIRTSEVTARGGDEGEGGGVTRDDG